MPMISDWLRTEERDTNADAASPHPLLRYRAPQPREATAEELQEISAVESINEHNDDAKEAS